MDKLVIAIVAALGIATLFVIREGILVFQHWREDRQNRKRLADPDYAFPSLSPTERPHDFKEFESMGICGKCGAGKKHQIHTGGPWPPAGGLRGVELSEETLALIGKAPKGNG